MRAVVGGLGGGELIEREFWWRRDIFGKLAYYHYWFEPLGIELAILPWPVHIGSLLSSVGFLDT